jgi:hypothetical protein
MAEKVRFWSRAAMDTVESAEEYTEFEVQASQEVNLWGNAHKQAITLVVYVHDGTGIMTNDPGAFEKWLRVNRLTQPE